jgi:hypothetical protein
MKSRLSELKMGYEWMAFENIAQVTIGQHDVRTHTMVWIIATPQ